MNILYLFKSSGKNIKLAEKNLYPKLFYGYFELRKNNNVQYMDVAKKYSLIRRVYNKFFHSNSLEKILYNNIDLLNEYDIIYATTDGIAIEVSKLKQKNLLNVSVVANIMSIADNEIQKKHLHLLNNLNGLICFSKKIETVLRENNVKKTRFIQFGVDTKFYKNFPKKSNGSILSIGLDKFRDWDFLIKIAELMPDVEFRVVTSNNKKTMFTLPNIIFLGDISFIETKNEIAEAKLIFLPTKYNCYFSGQTTLFNALSMEKYVLMPKDGNFDRYEFSGNMFYDRSDEVSSIVEKIELILRAKRMPPELKSNHHTLLSKYNEVVFSENIEKYMKWICEK
jgi:hypothetical protein